MRLRTLASFLLVAAMTLGLPAAVPAQTPPKKIIEISTTSYKYEPNEIRITEGETVVIRMRNVDPFGRPHNFSSTFLLNIPLTLRGEGREGISEGRKWVAVDAGKMVEFEFVARGRGSYAILCSIFDHAFRGHTGMLFVQAQGAP